MKKIFLYTLLASIAFSALLGIYVVVSGRHDSLAERVLVTAAIVAAASLCGLACGALLDARRARLVPGIGITCALAGSAIALVLIWSEADSQGLWKLAFSLGVLALAFAHLSLLLLARLADSFRWVLAAAMIVVLALAGVVIAVVLGALREDATERAIGVLAILDGAGTLAIPILHRLSREKLAPSDPAALDAEIARLRTRLAELERLRG